MSVGGATVEGWHRRRGHCALCRQAKTRTLQERTMHYHCHCHQQQQQQQPSHPHLHPKPHSHSPPHTHTTTDPRLPLPPRAHYDADQVLEAKRVLVKALHLAPTDCSLRFDVALTMQVGAGQGGARQVVTVPAVGAPVVWVAACGCGCTCAGSCCQGGRCRWDGWMLLRILEAHVPPTLTPCESPLF